MAIGYDLFISVYKGTECNYLVVVEDYGIDDGKLISKTVIGP